MNSLISPLYVLNSCFDNEGWYAIKQRNQTELE